MTDANDPSGGTLDVSGSGPFGTGGLGTVSGTIENGTLTATATGYVLSGNSGTLNNITIGSNLTGSGILYVTNGLTLANGATLTLNSNEWLFNTTETLGTVENGSATVALGNDFYLYANATGQTLTIGNGITINGYGAIYGNGNIVNNGTVSLGSTAGTSYIQPGTFTNNGTIAVSQGMVTLQPGTFSSSTGSFNVSGGTLNLNSNFTLSEFVGHVTRSGGTINLGGTLNLEGDNLNISSIGGFGTVSGTIENGTISASNGYTMTGSGGTLNNITVGSNLTCTGSMYVTGGLTLANGTTLTLSNNAWYFNGAQQISTPANGAATVALRNSFSLYANTANQTLSIGQGVTVNGYGSLFGLGNVANYGTLSLGSTAGTSSIQLGTFSNYGTVNVPAGTVTIQNTALTNANGGNINVEAGATLNLDNSTAIWSNLGNITETNGTLNLGGSFSLSALTGLSRTGGSINLTGTLNLANGSLDISSTGAFGTNGLGTVSGTIENGTISASTGYTMTGGGGTLSNITIGSNLTSTGPMYVTGGIALANGTTLTLSNNAWYFNGTQQIATPGATTVVLSNNAYLETLNSGDALTIGAGVTVSGYGGLYTNASNGTINNYGTISLGSTAGTAYIQPGTFNNYGTLNVPTGTVVVSPINPFSNAGSLNVAAASTLSTGNHNLTNTSTGTISGGGTINLGGTAYTLTNLGIVSPSGGSGVALLSINGNLNTASGTINLDIGGVTRGQVSNGYDSISVTGSATLGGTSTVNMSTMGGYSGTSNDAFLVVNAATGISGTFTTVNAPFAVNKQYATHDAVVQVGTTAVTVNLWDTDSSGNWNTTSNWSLGHVPQSTEIALIDRGTATPTVTLGTGSYTVSKLINVDTLTLSGGTLDVSGTVYNDGQLSVTNTGWLSFDSGATLNVAGGLVSFNLGSALTLPTLLVSGGTLQVAGTLNGSNAIQWTGGTLTGTGTLNANGGLLIGTGSTKSLAGSLTVNNYGTTTQSDWIQGANADSNATINNYGNWNLQGDVGFDVEAGTGLFNNYAALAKTGGTGTGSFSSGWSFNNLSSNNNVATVTVDSGTLRFDQGGEDTGTYTVAGGATLQFNGGTRSLSGGIAATSGTGTAATVSFSGGSTTINGSYSADATTVNGGTVTFNQSSSSSQWTLGSGTATENGAATIGNLTQTGGMLGGTGSLTVTQSFSRSGGTFGSTLTGLSITQAIGDLAPGALTVNGALSVVASTGSLNLDSLSATTLFAQSLGTHLVNGGGVEGGGGGVDGGGAHNVNSVHAITLNSGATLTATSTSGNSIILDASDGSFANDSGSATPLSTAGTGRWLIYAANPGSVTKNGMTSDFRHYSASYDTYATPTESGNGFIYASTAGDLTVTTTLASGSATSIYGNHPTAVYAYMLSGFSDSEDNASTIGLSGSATFSAPSETSAAGAYNVLYASGLASAAGYGFTAGSGVSYSVSARPVTLTGSRTYDGTTTLAASVFSIGNMANGDTLSLTGSGSVPSPHAGDSQVVSAGSLTLGNATGLASNYTLAGATLSATIAPAPLTVSFGTTTKVYDGNTSASLGTPSLGTVFAGDSANLSVTGIATYDTRQVGTGKSVTYSALALSGSAASDYTLSNTATTGLGSITTLSSVAWIGGTTGNWSNPANWAGGALPDGNNVLSVSIPSNVTVTFDGSNTANGFLGYANLQTLASSGNLSLSSGTLTIAQSLSTVGYAQTGGTFTGAGSFTASSSFGKSGGVFTPTGVVSLTQAVGDLDLTDEQAITLGTLNASNGNLTVNNTGGITTTLPISASGTISLTAHSPITIGSGGLAAGQGVRISAVTPDAASVINVNGSISAASGAISIDAYGSISIGHGALISGSSITVNSQAGTVTSNAANFSGSTPNINGNQNLPSTTPVADTSTVVSDLNDTNNQPLAQSTAAPVAAALSAPQSVVNSGDTLSYDGNQTIGGVSGQFGDTELSSVTLPHSSDRNPAESTDTSDTGNAKVKVIVKKPNQCNG